MSNIYKYLLKKVLISSAIILFAVTLLLFLLQSLRFLDWVTNRGLPISSMLYLSYLSFAGIWIEVIPFALVIAIVFTWNNIINNQELIIIQATGVTPLKTYISVITAGLLFSIITVFLSFYLVPNSYSQYQELRQNLTDNYNMKIFEAEKFIKINANTNFYIKKISGNKLTSIFIYAYNPIENKDRFIYAEEGYVDFSNGRITMLLNSVNIQEISATNSIAFLQLDKYLFDIDTKKKNRTYIKSNPREYNIKDLLNINNLPYVKSIKAYSLASYNSYMHEIKKELIKKFNIILFPLLISIIASYFFSIRRYKRLGNLKPILQTTILGALFKIFNILVLPFDSYLILTLPIVLSFLVGGLMLWRIVYPPSLKRINSYKIFA